MTHLATVATRVDRSFGINRTYHRAKCSCGFRGPERLSESLAADEAASHAAHALATVTAIGEGKS